jgi:hypothetical protein
MDQFIADELIARTNISKFKSHLQETSDHVRKATLRQLLESEECRLATILAESSSETSAMRTIQGNDS